MGINSFVKELLGDEKTIFKQLKSLYKNVKHDVYIFHDIVYTPDYGKSFRPDFIILDPRRGISIIEVKSYKNSLLKMDQTKLYFKNGDETTSPFVQASDYRLKLSDYFASRYIEVEKKQIKANLFFTRLNQRIEGMNDRLFKCIL